MQPGLMRKSCAVGYLECGAEDSWYQPVSKVIEDGMRVAGSLSLMQTNETLEYDHAELERQLNAPRYELDCFGNLSNAMVRWLLEGVRDSMPGNYIGWRTEMLILRSLKARAINP